MTVKTFLKHSGANWYNVRIMDEDETYFEGTIEEAKKSEYVSKKIWNFIIDGYEGDDVDNKMITLYIKDWEAWKSLFFFAFLFTKKSQFLKTIYFCNQTSAMHRF